jgi:hypothetical protein
LGGSGEKLVHVELAEDLDVDGATVLGEGEGKEARKRERTVGASVEQRIRTDVGSVQEAEG